MSDQCVNSVSVSSSASETLYLTAPLPVTKSFLWDPRPSAPLCRPHFWHKLFKQNLDLFRKHFMWNPNHVFMFSTPLVWFNEFFAHYKLNLRTIRGTLIQTCTNNTLRLSDNITSCISSLCIMYQLGVFFFFFFLQHIQESRVLFVRCIRCLNSVLKLCNLRILNKFICNI